jgi:hypothetical protein
MTTALEINTETKVNLSSNLSVNCYVTLADTEQIIISIEETEGVWSNHSYSQKKTGVISKYRLERLIYQTGYGNNEGEVFLHAIQVRGFKKDGGLRFRDTQFYKLDKETLDQIPDEYHNYARESFAKEVVKLQDRLTNLINKGVKVEPQQ